MDMATHASLRTLAMQANNVERAALGLENQIRRFKEDGWPDAAFAWSDEQIPALKRIRDRLMRQLVQVGKNTPIGHWQQSTVGLGPALYLVVGSMPPLTEFHSVAAVWKYAGLHVVDGHAPRRRAGQKVGFSVRLRSMVLMRVGDPCMKNRRSPFREVYDTRKAFTAGEHPDWTDGHRHADALRVMAKAILRDAWRVSNGQEPRISGEAIVPVEAESDPLAA